MRSIESEGRGTKKGDTVAPAADVESFIIGEPPGTAAAPSVPTTATAAAAVTASCTDVSTACCTSVAVSACSAAMCDVTSLSALRMPSS